MRRSAEVSAGLLAFRRGGRTGSPAGPSGRAILGQADEGAWTIPKGLVEPGDELLATARREFTEETNLVAAGDFMPLTPVKQKSGKVVHAFAVEADFDLSAFASNSFEIEWPPKSGRRRSFPEIDRIAYFALAGREGENPRLSTAAAARTGKAVVNSFTRAARPANRPRRAATPRARAARPRAIRSKPASP